MDRQFRLLLVEDEPVDVMTVRRALRQRVLRIELRVAGSAEEALAMLEREPDPDDPADDGPRPDLIVADLRLPQMSGLDLLERCKSDPALRPTPFVMLSTSTQDLEVSQAYARGAAGFFDKPVAFEEYADTIERIVRFFALAERSRGAAPVRAPLGIENGRHYLEAELERLLRDEPSAFALIEEEWTDGIWYWDLCEPEHEWMSPGFWRTFGYDPASKPHLASAWQDMIDPGDRDLALANFEKHCRDGDHAYDQTVRYRHHDGSTVWVRCRGVAIRDRSGRPVRMLGVHTNVSERKRAEGEIADLRRRLAAIGEALEAAPSESSESAGERVLDRIRALLS